MRLFYFTIIFLIFESCGFLMETTNEIIFYEKWQIRHPHEGKTIDQAMKEYFEKRTNILNVRIQLDYADSWKNLIFDNLVNVLSNTTILAYILNVQNTDRKTNDLYYHNVFYVDCYEALIKALPNFRGDRGNFAGRYMIMLRLARNRFEYKSEIKRMFEKLFELDIIYVNIVILNRAKQLVLYSYDVFLNPEACREIEPKVVNYFIDGSFKIPELFPEKLQHFHRCELTFMARNVPPFFTFAYNETDNVTKHVEGIESEIILAMAQYLNFTPKMYILDSHEWGDDFENGTITGPYLSLQNRSTDLLMGFFAYDTSLMRRFGKTTPYLLSPLIAVVNLKRELLTISATWLMDPFSRETWLLLLVTFLLAIAVISAAYFSFNKTLNIHQTRPRYPTWLEALGNALGIASPTPDGGGAIVLRFCIAIWGIGFMICTAAYEGKLFVAYNRFDTIRPMTLSELKRANYTFLVRQAYNSSQVLEDVLGVTHDRIVSIHTHDANDIYDLMTNYSGKVGTVATKLRIIYYMINQDYFEILHTLPEPLRMHQFCAYFRSHSYLIQPFNEILGKLQSNGMIKKFYTEAEYELNKKLSHLRSSWDTNEAKSLDMATFQPVFLGYLAFLLLALFSLFCELGLKCWQMKQNKILSRIRSKRSLKKCFNIKKKHESDCY